MKPHTWFICGAMLASFGVLNGAFAAHGLGDRLASIYADGELLAKRLAQYETGVRYQMYHAFGLVILGLAAARKKSAWWTVAGIGFVVGIAVFSGLLYLLVLTNRPYLGAFVPIGGVASIIAWLALAMGARGGWQSDDDGVVNK